MHATPSPVGFSQVKGQAEPQSVYSSNSPEQMSSFGHWSSGMHWPPWVSRTYPWGQTQPGLHSRGGRAQGVGGPHVLWQ